MTVRLYEWDKTETGWAWIEITDNKVVNLKLRDENNLIKINEDDEAYVDLQLESWIAPDDDFPVWVTTGRVLVADWRPVAWTVTISKTTSWDYTIYLYWDDGKVYVDNGTWEWHIVSFGYEAWEWISIDTAYSNARTRRYWNFHIPTSSEWQTLKNWTITNVDYAQYLRIPEWGGSLNVNDGSHMWGSNSNLWCSDVHWSDACCFSCGASSSSVAYSSRMWGFSLRLFADTPVIPDETWTLAWTRNNANIYRNEDLWLITVSKTSLWETQYITLKDKNEWATEAYVRNGGVGPTTASNCGYLYQRGNCHGFPWAWATDTSGTKVDASGYGPYKYEWNTFITGHGDWSTIQNDNLWAYEVPTEEVKSISNTGVLSVDWQTGHVTLWLWTAAYANIGTSEWNVPVLDASWRLDPAIVPSTWVMTTFTVTNKADLTTLTTAVKWDIWIVTSENKTYILSNDPYSTLSNWTELLFPTGSVSSVNWFTWAVNLTTGYIQESNNVLFTSPTEKATWNNKLWANNVSTVALTGNYGDLSNKPVIDTALNNSSTNAVQNKAIATAVNNINSSITSMQWDIWDLQTASGWAAQDIIDIKGDIADIQEDLTTKSFYLPWTWNSQSVLSVWQAIWDWWNNWGWEKRNPIIIYNNKSYILHARDVWGLWFLSTSKRLAIEASGSYTMIRREWLVVREQNWVVSSVESSVDTVGKFLSAETNYPTPYTPEYDWSPATKKYVDDSVANLGWLKFQVITQTAYTALNGTYAPNTVYLIKQG